MWCGTKLTVITLLWAAMTGAQASFPSHSHAQVQLPFSAGGFAQGVVTAVHDASIDIDGRSYSLKVDALIINDLGQPIEIGSVLLSSEVKFHLKAGQIDKMVVTLPR